MPELHKFSPEIGVDGRLRFETPAELDCFLRPEPDNHVATTTVRTLLYLRHHDALAISLSSSCFQEPSISMTELNSLRFAARIRSMRSSTVFLAMMLKI